MKIFRKIANWFSHALNVVGNFNPLNDKLYPWLLDRYGHKTARRVCSAIAIVILLTLALPIAAAVWVFNSAADLLVNVGYGWVRSFSDHVVGVISGDSGMDDENAGSDL